MRFMRTARRQINLITEILQAAESKSAESAGAAALSASVSQLAVSQSLRFNLGAGVSVLQNERSWCGGPRGNDSRRLCRARGTFVRLPRHRRLLRPLSKAEVDRRLLGRRTKHASRAHSHLSPRQLYLGDSHLRSVNFFSQFNIAYLNHLNIFTFLLLIGTHKNTQIPFLEIYIFTRVAEARALTQLVRKHLLNAHP